jgi:hypothetical protein
MASSKQQADLEQAVDRLYGLPVAAFTSERNKLAARLRKEGDKEAAEEVTSLKKPTLAAWAANQLARTERMKIRALMETAEQLRKTQAKLLEGGSPQRLREADERFSKVTSDLRDAAGGLLRQAGHPASEALLDRVRQTLRAAVVNDSDRERLRRGRLVEELDPAGFGGLVGEATTSGRSPRKGTESTRRRAEERRKQKLTAARARFGEQREAVASARSGLRDAERNEAEAAKSVREAEKRLRREEAKLEQAKSELEHLG